MKWPAYPNYKASGIDWLGDVADNWEVKRIKHLVSIPVTDGPHETPEIFSEGIPFVSAEAINNSRINFQKIRGHISIEDHKRFSKKYLPRKGDIYLVKSGATTGRIAMVETDVEFNIWSPLAAIRCNPNVVDRRFIFFYLQSKEFQTAIELNWSFGTQQNIGMGVIQNLFVPVPPLSEQTTIAAFLSSAITKVDRLIDKKRAVIDKLKENRGALISLTVTKGLPPEVAEEYAAKYPELDAKALAKRKFKPSGMDWLGDAPKGWEVKRLKHVIRRLVSGVSVNSDAVPAESGEIGILKTSCVYGNRFDPLENKRVLETEEERVSCPVTRNSLIISRMNTPELVGNCGFVDNDHPNLFLPDRLWITYFSSTFLGCVKFFWYLVISRTIQSLTAILATGTSDSMKNLTQSDFLNISFAMPPTDEQFAIVAYLDRETSQIDRMIEKVEAAIAKLSEYRTALITAAVTGKIDVRGFKP